MDTQAASCTYVSSQTVHKHVQNWHNFAEWQHCRAFAVNAAIKPSAQVLGLLLNQCALTLYTLQWIVK